MYTYNNIIVTLERYRTCTIIKIYFANLYFYFLFIVLGLFQNKVYGSHDPHFLPQTPVYFIIYTKY